MAVVNFVKVRRTQTVGGLNGVLKYCCREEKVDCKGRSLVSGINCVPDTALQEFMNTKRLYHSTGGRMYYHMLQSFRPDDPVTPERAHEIALKLAEQIPGFEIVVATHTDRDHIHSHFVINSVSCETGKKYHSNKDSLMELRAASDKLCQQYGLSVIKPKPKKDKVHRMSDREYRAYDKGESWKMALEMCIDECMTLANDREHFFRLMEWSGYGVRWTEERKYITYTTPEGHRCRDIRLNGEKYHKEVMEYEFAIRKEIAGGIETAASGADGYGSKSPGHRAGYGQQLEDADKFTADPGGYADTDIGEAGHTDNGRSAGGVYGTADGNSAAARRGIHLDHGTVPADADGVGAEYNPADPTGSRLDGETGWEREREIWAGNLTGELTHEAADQAAVLDRPDSQSALSGVGIDAAYLAADLSGIIEEDAYVEDCTTKHFRPERKKRHGQTMGGM